MGHFCQNQSCGQHGQVTPPPHPLPAGDTQTEAEEQPDSLQVDMLEDPKGWREAAKEWPGGWTQGQGRRLTWHFLPSPGLLFHL